MSWDDLHGEVVSKPLADDRRPQRRPVPDASVPDDVIELMRNDSTEFDLQHVFDRRVLRIDAYQDRVLIRGVPTDAQLRDCEMIGISNEHVNGVRVKSEER